MFILDVNHLQEKCHFALKFWAKSQDPRRIKSTTKHLTSADDISLVENGIKKTQRQIILLLKYSKSLRKQPDSQINTVWFRQCPLERQHIKAILERYLNKTWQNFWLKRPTQITVKTFTRNIHRKESLWN